MNCRCFSESEDAYLREHYDDELSGIAVFLNRSESGIRKRIAALGLTRSPRRADWSAEMDADLTRMVGEGATDNEIAKAVGVSRAGVRLRMTTLGVMRPRVPSMWSPDRQNELRRLHARGDSDRSMARALKASESSVRRQRELLGLAGRAPTALIEATEDQIEAIYQLRAIGAGYIRIGRTLGISVRAVQRQLEADGEDDFALQSRRDRAFVARLMQDGGLPRAEIRKGFTVWLGPDGKPWFDPDRRRIAA